MRWFYSTDARDIGVLYLLLSFFSGILGTLLSMVIRVQLMDIDQKQILALPDTLYNNVITVHAILMIFFLVMPAMFGGFGNLFLPSLIGALDMAFPRLNNVSFWLLFSSLVLAASSMMIGVGIGTGWTVKIGCLEILLDAWKFSKNLNINTQYIFLKFYLGTFYNKGIYWCKNFINKGITSQVDNKYQPSETESLTRDPKNGSKCKKLDINWWLVGFTDGDGCFNIYINQKDKKINFTFKLSQKTNNIRILYFIKKFLGVGSIIIDKKNNMVSYIIRDKKIILEKIIPLFDNYPLKSKKLKNYIIFKESINITNNNLLSQKEKIDKILNLKKSNINISFINQSINKSWLIGFTEAEGSFYITLKEKKRLTHGFAITQKYDKILLESIIKELKIKNPLKLNKRGFYIIDTTNSITLKYIKDYFFKTMKGIKSFEYRIWARSFKYKGNYEKLLKIKNLIHKIRSNQSDIIKLY